MYEKTQKNLEPRFHPQEHSDKMRWTSEEAYRQIRDEGLLSKTRFLVYEYLRFNGPATGQEINDCLSGTSGGVKGYHKRLSELRDLGVVEEYAIRKCRVTGRQAIAWRVTDAIPNIEKTRRAKPGIAALRAALADMRRVWLENEKAGTPLSQGLVDTMAWIATMVPAPCPTCKGMGSITHQGGFSDTCPSCKGKEK
jgi:hypothetical protein